MPRPATRSASASSCDSRRSCRIDGPVFVDFFAGTVGVLGLPPAGYFPKGSFASARIVVPCGASVGVEVITVEHGHQVRVSGIESMRCGLFRRSRLAGLAGSRHHQIIGASLQLGQSGFASELPAFDARAIVQQPPWVRVVAVRGSGVVSAPRWRRLAAGLGAGALSVVADNLQLSASAIDCGRGSAR